MEWVTSMYIELCKVCLCQLEQRTNFLEEGGHRSVNTLGLSFLLSLTSRRIGLLGVSTFREHPMFGSYRRPILRGPHGEMQEGGRCSLRQPAVTFCTLVTPSKVRLA
jgi:hypothetical protein